METDRIVKQIVLRAPRARVWRAVADAAEFGQWFGMRFEGAFAPGARMRGVIVPTTADAEMAKAQKSYEGTPFEFVVERMEPERLLSFRWHPGAIDPAVDYSKEPTTLVEFTLEDTPEGTLLTVTESGFDQIPLTRRAKAFEQNSGGWAMAMKLIEKHLAHAA